MDGQSIRAKRRNRTIIVTAILSGAIFCSASPLKRHLQRINGDVKAYELELSQLKKSLQAPKENVDVIELAKIIDQKSLLELKLNKALRTKSSLERQLFNSDYNAYLKVLNSPDTHDSVKYKAWGDICKIWNVIPMPQQRHLIWSDEQKKVVSINQVGEGSPQEHRVIGLGDGVDIEVLWCSPGTFIMGSNGGYSEDESPAHKVLINRGFWISIYEVTEKQYNHIRGLNKAEGTEEQPVTNISWNEAATFCDRVSVLTRLRCELPSEAQWEYACRAGTTNEYPGIIDNMAWTDENSKPQKNNIGLKEPNAWGIYDMSGNIREWCADTYDPSFYERSEKINPLCETGESRVVRGGCWFYDSNYARSAKRGFSAPHARNDQVGLRVIFY